MAGAPAAVLALHAPEPLYRQVKDRLVEGLRGGEWRPGDMLPSEPELAARFGVSISTVRAAIAQLVAANVLARRQGKGTYVSRHEERRDVHQFFHVVRDDGVRELPRSELLAFSAGRADDETADLLRLPRLRRPREVFRIRNLLRVGPDPVVLSDITIPSERLPGASAARLRRGGDTLYAAYQSLFGLDIVRTVEEIRAGRADALAARLLRMRAGEPLLDIRRVAFTFDDVPVEVRRIRVDTRHHYYHSMQGGVS